MKKNTRPKKINIHTGIDIGSAKIRCAIIETDIVENTNKLLGVGSSDSLWRAFAERQSNELRHAIEITFDSYRNYAAHPRDGEVPRHIIKGNLGVFPLFCQRVYQGIGWFGGNDV